MATRMRRRGKNLKAGTGYTSRQNNSLRKGAECGHTWASLVAQMAKNLPGNAGHLGSIPGLGSSGEGNG